MRGDIGVGDMADVWSSGTASVRGGHAHRAPKWPLYVLWALSAAGVLIALFQNSVWSAFAYGVLVVAGGVLLFRYRLMRVAVTRSATASVTVVGIRADERLTILALVLACVANGIVIGMWVGSWEIWF